ncbi:MAG: YjgP/YjgQ family permease [Ignavibacteriaceae bacterium]|nr:YjgP/YjgQ family permease [Ignavibacteriaceae bacterium]
MILIRYILKSHFAPFIFSAFTLTCILLLQFLMKFADRLVGKGLDTFIVLQLIAYNLAWMVVLVIPMACLVATLMAFGAMSQNNEITIIKSSGVSLWKMMIGPLAASAVLCYLLILFNNHVLPDANHKAKLLTFDISRTKPTLSLEPGLFSQEVSNYAILVRMVDKNSNLLEGVTIYDYTDPSKISVVTAKKGRIYFSKDQTKLIMELEQGEIHESELMRKNMYRRLIFSNHRISMNADQFSFQQSTPGGPRGDRELSSADMKYIIDSLQVIKSKQDSELVKETGKYFIKSIVSKEQRAVYKSANREFVYTNAIENLNTSKSVIISTIKRVEYTKSEINSYWVEIHKKYSIPAACIIFVLIGAPLGVMTRKGGFGMAASISLFFFLIYWAFLIGGEKLADRNLLSPFLGMWSANFLLGAIGILLTMKSVRETVTLEFNWIQKLIPKNWKSQDNTTED